MKRGPGGCEGGHVGCLESANAMTWVSLRVFLVILTGASVLPPPCGPTRIARPWAAVPRPGRPSCHPSAMARGSPSSPVPTRFSSLPRFPRSPWPMHASPPPDGKLPASHTLPRYAVPVASASPYMMTCRPAACGCSRVRCLHGRRTERRLRCEGSQKRGRGAAGQQGSRAHVGYCERSELPHCPAAPLPR